MEPVTITNSGLHSDFRFDHFYSRMDNTREWECTNSTDFTRSLLSSPMFNMGVFWSTPVSKIKVGVKIVRNMVKKSAIEWKIFLC